MQFVTCEPTIRPVCVKMRAVMAKKNEVASAASSPMKFIGESFLYHKLLNSNIVATISIGTAHQNYARL